jgi:hypothetical protein
LKNVFKKLFQPSLSFSKTTDNVSNFRHLRHLARLGLVSQV